MAPLNIFILGGTGYVGGTILEDIFKRENFEITVLVRSNEKALALEALKLGSLHVVVGTATDAAILETCVNKADIIIDTFNSDDVEGTAVLLGACKKRFDTTKEQIALIHVSGCAVLKDEAMGRYASDTIWDDTDTDKLAQIPSTQPHREADLEVLKADAAGYIKSYLVIPGAIYGHADTVLSQAGIQKDNDLGPRMSIGHTVALAGSPAAIGGGLNLWPWVHVEDVSSLILTILDNLDNAPHGPEGYYFAENIEIETGWPAAIAARSMGTSSPTVRAFTEEEVSKFFPPPYDIYAPLLAGNCRCRGTRARRLGWKPKYDKDHLERDIARLTESIIKS
ncbi:NAD(P)-binding protein [Cylindrobasidium torrendii FP15055 ss-10]|uniref:NAD(P)-binding protein n=1 Tax=Cylindrobasidium torrendii FP15055 ss-10 TaxID=1314674 RepID=A0A0D7B0Q6_9AGAR|nr:NAD(P)-binding protein [Cylindrobasidium torrendii FP15055 ss-10]